MTRDWEIVDERRSEELRKKPLGASALNLLADMADNNYLIIYSSNDWQGQLIRFWNSSEISEVIAMGQREQLRAPAIMAALENRGYIECKDSYFLINEVNQECMEKGEMPFSTPSPIVNRSKTKRDAPWGYKDILFRITDLGREEVAKNAKRLGKINQNPEAHWIATKATDSLKNIETGLGGIWRVTHETASRYYVNEGSQDEGYLSKSPWDRTLRTHGNWKNSVKYVLKRDVLVDRITPDQSHRLIELSSAYERSCQGITEILENLDGRTPEPALRLRIEEIVRTAKLEFEEGVEVVKAMGVAPDMEGAVALEDDILENLPAFTS